MFSSSPKPSLDLINDTQPSCLMYVTGREILWVSDGEGEEEGGREGGRERGRERGRELVLQYTCTCTCCTHTSLQAAI